MVAATGSTRTRNRRRNPGGVLLFCGIFLLLQVQISIVYSLDGNTLNAGVNAGGANSGVVIRHGRSRGRHSSERRSQQHQEGSNADTIAQYSEHTDNSASKIFIEGIGHSAPRPSSGGSAVVVADGIDNETTRPRPEKIIRLERGGQDGVLPYHPHPVRFSHKKAIEAKYKILKLTEKGLTNLKWQQQQLVHRKHVAEEASADDAAKRRSLIAEDEHKGESKGSIISGKQLPLATETRLLQTVSWQEPHKDNSNEANNYPPDLSAAYANIEYPVSGDKDAIKNHSVPDPVTHLHSYLFKTMPRKRQQPQPDRHGTDLESGNIAIVQSGHNSSKNREMGAASGLDNGEPNKSISSGPDRTLAAMNSVEEDEDSTAREEPEGQNVGLAGRIEIQVSPKTMEIGSEQNVEETWKGADNRNDNVLTARKESNGPAEEVQGELMLKNSSRRINKEALPTGSVVGRLRKTFNNTSSLNTDNGNLNETKSNETADKRNHKDKVTERHALNVEMSKTAKRGGPEDDKSKHQQQQSQHHAAEADTLEEKIEETAPDGEKIMTTERTWTETLPAVTVSTTDEVVAETKDKHDAFAKELQDKRRNNKSESFSDREMNRVTGWEQQDVRQTVGQVNESIPMISSGNESVAEVTGVPSASATAEDETATIGRKLNKTVTDQDTPTNPRKNVTEWKNGGPLMADEMASADTQEDDPLMTLVGYSVENEGSERVDNELEGIDREDTSSALDDTVKWDDSSRNNRLGLRGGYDKLSRFLQTVEQQHLLGANCTAGTSLNLGEGVVDRYAQERFRIQAEIAVNRANMLTR